MGILMSAKADLVRQLAAQRVPAPLSQDVVAGIVVFSDALSVLLSALLVHGVFEFARGYGPFPPLGVVALATTALLLSFNAADLYRFPVIMRPAEHMTKVMVMCIGVGMALVALGFALKVLVDFSRAWALMWLLTSIGLVLGFRFLVSTSMRRLAKAGRIGRRIMVYGAGPQGEKLVRRIDALDEPWNRIVGVFDDRDTRIQDTVAGYPVIGNLSDLLNRGHRERPDEVLVALPWGAEDRILQVLRRLAVLPANVRLAPEFQSMDQIQGRTNSQFGLPMLNAFEKPVDGWGRIWKRLFDFGLATMVVIIAGPLMLLIALVIRLESPGPVLFRQPRFGFNNKLIEVYKFRTMRTQSSDTLGEQLTERGDVRVTRVGAFLRRSSLDELPQLLNVLRSEMSLVGPRPHAIRTTAGGRQCDEVVDQYAVRHKVKPGITGWAQVNGWRGTMETEEHLVKRLEHDLYYINNWSPLLDIRILAMTVWSVLNGRNSY
jgi:Undecaprenyl-phosphate glucose phosphotransferase